MDAADPRIDHLSGTDCTGGNILYGILKKREASKRVPLFSISVCNLSSSLTVISPHNDQVVNDERHQYNQHSYIQNCQICHIFIILFLVSPK